MCRWTGMTIKIYLREKAVDMGKHLGHEIPAELPTVISQAVGTQMIAGKKQQPQVFKGIRCENDRPGLLHLPATEWIDVFDPAGVTVAIREDANHPATGPQIEIPGCQCFGNRGERRIPLISSR